MSRATTIPTWKLAASGSLAAAAALAGALALLAYSGLPAFPFTGRVLGFSEPHDRRSLEALVEATRLEDLLRAEREAEAALALSPYNNLTRLRLAYIEAERLGRLGPQGLTHLSRSYDLVPLDASAAPWRVRLALEHWGQLTPDIRMAVYREAMAFGRSGSREADVRPVLASIRNPEGRLAAALWLRALRR